MSSLPLPASRPSRLPRIAATRTIALFVMGIALFCACSGLARRHGERMPAPFGERA